LLVEFIEVGLGEVVALSKEETGEDALWMHDADPESGGSRVEVGAERPRVPAEEGHLRRRHRRVRRDCFLPADQLHEVHAYGREVLVEGDEIVTPNDSVRHRHGEVIAVNETVDVRVEGVLNIVVLKPKDVEGTKEQFLVE
jgi:hypothetical protein